MCHTYPKAACITCWTTLQLLPLTYSGQLKLGPNSLKRAYTSISSCCHQPASLSNLTDLLISVGDQAGPSQESLHCLLSSFAAAALDSVLCFWDQGSIFLGSLHHNYAAAATGLLELAQALTLHMY